MPGQKTFSRLPHFIFVGEVALIFGDKLVVAERVVAQLAGQIDVANGQEIRTQTTNLVLGHLSSKQCSEGAYEEVAEHSVELHDNERDSPQTVPVLSRALRADLLLPFFVLVGFEVEDFDEDDEENDDADPDDDAVSNADLFGDVGMLQTLICTKVQNFNCMQ